MYDLSYVFKTVYEQYRHCDYIIYALKKILQVCINILQIVINLVYSLFGHDILFDHIIKSFVESTEFITLI